MQKILFLTLILFCLFSCVNCKLYTKDIKEEECIILVETLPTPNTVNFKVSGYDPITQKTKTCKSANRWWNQYNDEIEIGDTIIKRKGELTFNIHKKDTIISHKWHCYENGKLVE